MIVRMAKVRIMGPRGRLEEVLLTLQDAGVLHLAEPCREPALEPIDLDGRAAREWRHLRRILSDVELALRHVEGFGLGVPATPAGVATRSDLARAARLARRVGAEAVELRERLAGLQEERGLILKYRPFLDAFGPFLLDEAGWRSAAAYHVVIRHEDASVLGKLGEALGAVIGPDFVLHTQSLPSGELIVLILVRAVVARQVERIMGELRLQEIPVPASFGGGSLVAAAPLMLARLQDIPDEIARAQDELTLLAEQHRATLEHAECALRDRIEELQALPLSCVSEHAFVVEGWLPAREGPTLADHLTRRFGGTVVVEELPADTWQDQEAPVVLLNRRLVRPFEAVLRLLPPPHYGSVDPAIFVALFFPLFFGLMLGDIGYGLLVGALALFLRGRSEPGSVLRAVSEIAGLCALSTVAFGVAFGELFGDLGHRLFGLQPVLLNREEEMVSLLALAVGIGVVHILLGLVLGVLTARRRGRRLVVARGLTAGMLVVLGVVLASATGLVPGGLLLPGVALLVLGVAVLTYCEGIAAPIEFLSTVGNILSYARLMALGTASVMLAAVANELAGETGSLALGLVVGVLFHAVNLVLGLFSPSIHSLRLHYVEFFGKFYDPGGRAYRPFVHWTPGAN